MDTKHPSYDDVLEPYVMNTLSDSKRDIIEEHLLICQLCRDRLDEAGDFVVAIRHAAKVPESADDHTSRRRLRRFVHDTEDGLIVSEVTRFGPRKWFARHWGSQLDGGMTVRTLEEAMDYLTESFQQLFPEHECSGRCEGRSERGVRSA